MKLKFWFLGFLIIILSSIRTSLGTEQSVVEKAARGQSLTPAEYRQLGKLLGWVASSQNSCGYFEEPPQVKKKKSGPLLQSHTIITAKGPVILSAQGISTLNQDVLVTQAGRIIKADKAYLYRDQKKGKISRIVLLGNVRLYESGKLIISDKATLNLAQHETILVQVAYHFYNERPRASKVPLDSWGVASQAVRNDNVIILKNAFYTTCPVDHPTWELRAASLVLDKKKQIGQAYHATLRFKGAPLVALPYYSFSLNHERKSGFLSPQIGYGTHTGGVFAIPFYWNMAPNYDLLLKSSYLTQRHLKFDASFRFLSSKSLGYAGVEILPYDPQFVSFRQDALATYANTNLYNPSFYAPYLDELSNDRPTRSFFTVDESTQLNSNWKADFTVNKVSDAYYFQDTASLTGKDPLSDQLLNRVELQYTGEEWQFRGLLQGYQTLHLINQTENPALDQYRRLPDLQLKGYVPNFIGPLDFNSSAEFVNFDYQSDFTPNNPIGQRWHWRPGLSWPIYWADGYVKPEIWGDMVAYHVENNLAPVEKNPTRFSPIFAVDSGYYFERSVEIYSHPYLQTLEPHLFYLNIPYQNQDKLPNFDTVLLPFSFEQLFALNRFTGVDRLSNTNQLTASLSSRLIDAQNGNNILTASIGAIAYFKPQRVCLTPNCQPMMESFSPIVGDLAYHIDVSSSLSGNISWDPILHEVNNAGVNYIYHPDDKRAIRIGYLSTQGNAASLPTFYNTTPIYSKNTHQITLAFAWPLGSKWRTINYWSYNQTQKRTDNFFTGLQYDSCCWALQFIVQKTFAGTNTSATGAMTNRFDTFYFVQLQLKGLGEFRLANLDKTLASVFPEAQ